MTDECGFDVYYSDPLNQAHFLRRKAESAVASEHFERAIQLHENAADQLDNLLETCDIGSTNQKAIISLRLQIERHRKQSDLLSMKKRKEIKSCNAYESYETDARGKKMVALLRQHQREILFLSRKLQEKEKENELLRTRMAVLLQSRDSDSVTSSIERRDICVS